MYYKYVKICMQMEKLEVIRVVCGGTVFLLETFLYYCYNFIPWFIKVMTIWVPAGLRHRAAGAQIGRWTRLGGPCPREPHRVIAAPFPSQRSGLEASDVVQKSGFLE